MRIISLIIYCTAIWLAASGLMALGLDSIDNRGQAVGYYFDSK